MTGSIIFLEDNNKQYDVIVIYYSDRNCKLTFIFNYINSQSTNRTSLKRKYSRNNDVDSLRNFLAS